MRNPAILFANLTACATVSSWVAPTSASNPGRSTSPTISPSTRTLARLTRCTTARTQASLPERRTPSG
jgi:hypothetical protein